VDTSAQFDFGKLCEKFMAMDSTALIKYLTQSPRSLQEVSYGLHYLANRYFQAGKFELGYAYLKSSALDYYNPLSMLRMGQIAFTSEEKVKQDFGPVDFKRDLGAAYRYVHRAMDLATLMMGHYGNRFQQRYVFDLVTKPGLPLLEILSSEEFTKQFDLETEQSLLEKELLEQRQGFVKLYGTSSSLPQPSTK
jgi:hypothetical protein